MPVLVIVAVLVACFVYGGFAAKDRPAAAPSPPPPALPVPRPGLVVQQAAYHQCWLMARINGVVRRFLVDSGAWTILLAPSDLDALGISRHGIVFDRPMTTANGPGKAADIRLRRLEVGELVLNDVAAQVSERGTVPLLGASVLRHFKLEFGRGVCVLTPLPDGRSQ